MVVMVLAVLVNLALLGAVGVVLAWLAFDQGDWAYLLLLLLIPLGAVMVRSATPGRRGRKPTADDQRRVEASLQRLGLVADIDPPRVRVERVRTPLSWTLAVPFRGAAIHVTTGLLDHLDDHQLAAALAHELAHVMHGDATVMTLMAAPGIWAIQGLREVWDDEVVGQRVWPFFALVAPAALVLTVSGRWLSRQRELAADRRAAELTGSPAAVASALVALSDSLARTRRRDLRLVAARDLFHFVPVAEARGLRRLWATHPPLARRIERLRRLERGLQRP